jgi:hypothetical protein
MIRLLGLVVSVHLSAEVNRGASKIKQTLTKQIDRFTQIEGTTV